MCKRIEAIEAQNRAADELTEAVEAALHGPVPNDPMSKVVHLAFRELSVTPTDMAVQLGRMR